MTDRIRRGALVLMGAAALGAGGLTAAASSAGATRPLVTATGQKLGFSTKTLRAPTGKVTLKLTNRGDLAHNIAIRGTRLARPKLGRIVGTGKVSTVVVTLPPGTYTYYCSVFGHERGGMRGTLTVKKR